MAKASFLFDESGSSVPLSDGGRLGLITDIGGSSYLPFSCTITSPAPGAGLPQGVPVTVMGTLSGAVAVVQVKLGAAVLGSASIVGKSWSYTWTPQPGDVGVQTLNATATNTTGNQANAQGVAVTVQISGTPLTLITSVPVRTWLRADLGVTIATGVSAWVDQTANAYAFNQATGANQPTRNAADATLNNLATITGDGVNDSLTSSTIQTLQSYWMCLVMKQVSWTAGGRLTDSPGSPNCMRLTQSATTPQLTLVDNGSTAANAGAPVGAWKRVTVLENQTAADGMLVGSVFTGGASLGRASGIANQLSLFANWGGSAAWGNFALAELIITDGLPTPTEKSNIDAMLLARYQLASLFT